MRDTFVEDRLPPPELLPEFRFDLPELHYPERLNAAAELLKCGAPDALAVVNDHGQWTYSDLDDFSAGNLDFAPEQIYAQPNRRGFERVLRIDWVPFFRAVLQQNFVVNKHRDTVAPNLDAHFTSFGLRWRDRRRQILRLGPLD